MKRFFYGFLLLYSKVKIHIIENDVFTYGHFYFTMKVMTKYIKKPSYLQLNLMKPESFSFIFKFPDKWYNINVFSDRKENLF